MYLARQALAVEREEFSLLCYMSLDALIGFDVALVHHVLQHIVNRTEVTVTVQFLEITCGWS